MERPFIALVAAAAALGLTSSALAQRPAEEAPASSFDRSESVSDQDLATFADIYTSLQKTASKYETEMLGVETEEQARNVQERMQQESVATVTQHGWTPERYVLVAQAISADPALADKTRTLIDRR